MSLPGTVGSVMGSIEIDTISNLVVGDFYDSIYCCCYKSNWTLFFITLLVSFFQSEWRHPRHWYLKLWITVTQVSNKFLVLFQSTLFHSRKVKKYLLKLGKCIFLLKRVIRLFFWYKWNYCFWYLFRQIVFGKTKYVKKYLLNPCFFLWWFDCTSVQIELMIFI